MASNVTGIPAAGVTGVLPAGVTGGSGLTALGTVATGNLSNTAIVYPAGHVIKQQTFLKTSSTWNTSTGFVAAFSWTYSPDGGSGNDSTIYCTLFWSGEVPNTAVGDGRHSGNWQCTGDDITNVNDDIGEYFGSYDHGGSGVRTYGGRSISCKPVTLDGTGNADLTYQFNLACGVGGSGWTMSGHASIYKTFAVVTEVQ
jgi:hypothetical protein